MTNSSIKQKVKTKLGNLLLALASILLNVVFLCFWLAAQYLLAYVISLLSTDEMNKLMIVVFKSIFAISTIIPILINLYKDIRIMIIQSNKEIEAELISKTQI